MVFSGVGSEEEERREEETANRRERRTSMISTNGEERGESLILRYAMDRGCAVLEAAYWAFVCGKPRPHVV